MIDGLKLRVTSQEIADHCRARADHHRSRAQQKSDELPSLKEAADRLKLRQPVNSLGGKNIGNAYSADPDDLIERLESDIRDHQGKALLFDFFASHLFAEDYTLTENDLVRLEMLKR